MTINPAPAGDPPNPAPVADPPAPSLEALQAQLAETNKALKAANHESAERRKKLDALEAAEAERQKAAMSETERLTAEAKDAQAKAAQAEQARADTEARATERLMRAAVLEAATKAGFQDPNDAWVHVERAKIKAKDDGDSFEGVTEAVKAVAVSKPYLVGRTERPNGTPRPGAKNQPKQNDGEKPRRRLSL